MLSRNIIDEILKDYKFLIKVPLEFIEDKFNLQNLKLIDVHNLGISYAILTNNFDWNCEDVKMINIEEYSFIARELYIELHQRYILTCEGLGAMKKQISKGIYGFCKNPACCPTFGLKIPLLPGVDNPNFSLEMPCPLSVYCSHCDTYTPSDPNDTECWLGHAFGTSFIAKYILQNGATRGALTFKPTLYGFVLHPKMLNQISKIEN